MSNNLYETLGLDRTASPEDIRKAYKKKALSTHPDRLPQNVSEADRQRANEQFRLVNNAYEVLNNTENRKLYDQYGVWPPPAPEPEYERADQSYTRPSRDPFSRDPFFSRRAFVFTDPFELFNSLFGDLHGHFADDPFFADVFPSSSRQAFGRAPFAGSPFGGTMFGDSLFDSPFGGSLLGPSMFSGPLITDGGMGSSRRSYSAVSQAMGSGGRWVSQSQMTRTINGRTETIIKKRDAEGNEHVTYLSPDGERHTINGIEQPSSNSKAIKSPPPPSAAAAPPQPPAVPLTSGAVASQTTAPRATYAPPQDLPAVSTPPAPPKNRSSHVSRREVPRSSNDDGRRLEKVRRTTSDDNRHGSVDQAREYDNSGHRRSSSSRHLRDNPGASQPQIYAQPPPPPQPQAYSSPQIYAQPQAYGQPQPYAPQAYDYGHSQPQPQYGRTAGTRADPIYVDDHTPVIPPPQESYPHAGDKRSRGDGDGRHDAEHRKKWWNGWLNGLNGLLKHMKLHHHE